MRLTLVGLVATLLTAVGMHAVIEGGWWFWASALCAGAAVGFCALARLAGMARPMVPLAGFVGLVLAVTQLSSTQTAVLGVLPGPAAVRQYVDLMHRAGHWIQVSVPPAPNKASLVAMVAGGVGLIALLVDTFAVTYRAAALAGLPLLALYGVPVAVAHDGVPWPYFAVAAIGWLALLLADGQERLGRWGRAVRRETEEPRTGRMVTGRRIGAAALGLALVVPALLPGLGNGVIDTHRAKRTGGGSGKVLTINPLVSIGATLNQASNTELLEYRTSTTDPGYLTLVVADTFDGTTWQPATLHPNGSVDDHRLPALDVDSDVSRQSVSTSLQSVGLGRSTWLPTPTPLVAVDADSSWVYDDAHRIPWSASGDIDNLAWRAISLDVQPTADQLKRAPAPSSTVLDTYTKLPGGIDASVPALAREVTKGATTEYEKALALQTFFRDGTFTYNAAYRPPRTDPLGAFLAAKQGFCQQFATAYAVMARELGIPTRVAVGFLPGHRTDTTDPTSSWVVYSHDMHAWPEVYFSGVGWVRFEPTPRADNAALTLPAYAVPNASASVGSSASATASLGKGGPSATSQASASSAVAGAGWSPGHLLPHLPWTWVVGLLALLVLLAAPWLARRVLLRRRLARAGTGDPVAAAAAAWAELEATCVDLGLEWPSSRTPRQTAAALSGAVEGDAVPALSRIGLATERARYAATPAPADGLDADVAAVRVALMERATPTERLRADVLPRSVLRRAGTWVADALDRVDDLLATRPVSRK